MPKDVESILKVPSSHNWVTPKPIGLILKREFINLVVCTVEGKKSSRFTNTKRLQNRKFYDFMRICNVFVLLLIIILIILLRKRLKYKYGTITEQLSLCTHGTCATSVRSTIIRLKAEEKPSDSPEMLRSVLSRTKDKRKWCATLLLVNKA